MQGMNPSNVLRRARDFALDPATATSLFVNRMARWRPRLRKKVWAYIVTAIKENPTAGWDKHMDRALYLAEAEEKQNERLQNLPTTRMGEM